MSVGSSTPVRKLDLLARVELKRVRLALRVARTQASLIALAVLLGVGGIGMLMLCLYTILADMYGHVAGALITGLALLILAFLIHLWASNMHGGSEGRALDELEEMLVSDLKSDVARAEASLRRLEAGAISLLSGSFLRTFFGGERRSKTSRSDAGQSETAPPPPKEA